MSEINNCDTCKQHADECICFGEFEAPTMSEQAGPPPDGPSGDPGQ